jgi:hypothetical protein
MAVDIRALMEPFSISIFAKARALSSPELKDSHRSRLRESISDDIKKASNFHPHRMSKAAQAKALALNVNLEEKTWHDQHSFDPGRQLFIVEHMVTVSELRERCLRVSDQDGVLAVLTNDLRIVWILREEDERLTALKYRSKRPATAYEEALIELWEG